MVMFGFKNGKIVESVYTPAEQEAMWFLRECLSEGETSFDCLLSVARKEGVSRANLITARNLLKIETRKDSQGSWLWSLPTPRAGIPVEVRCTPIFVKRWKYRSYSGGKYIGMSELTNIWRCTLCHCWSSCRDTLLEQVCEKRERRRPGKDRRAV